jgi:hypothetical protein
VEYVDLFYMGGWYPAPSLLRPSFFLQARLTLALFAPTKLLKKRSMTDIQGVIFS